MKYRIVGYDTAHGVARVRIGNDSDDLSVAQLSNISVVGCNTVADLNKAIFALWSSIQAAAAAGSSVPAVLTRYMVTNVNIDTSVSGVSGVQSTQSSEAQSTSAPKVTVL